MSNRYSLTGITPASIISSFMEDPFFSIGFGDLTEVPTKVSNVLCSAVYPKADIYTTEDGAYHIECGVGGYSEDEITAEYKDNYITLSLKKAEPKEKRNYLQRGLKYSSREESQISFYIDPTYYDADKAEVKLEKGIFSITCPRSERLASNRMLFGKKKEEPAKLDLKKAEADDAEAKSED